MNLRARRALGLSALVVLAALAVLAWKAESIRAGVRLRRLSSLDAAERKAAAADLWRSGPGGVALLESIAFSPEGESLAARQTAYDELWSHEDKVSEERLARFLVGGCGLTRGPVLVTAHTRLARDFLPYPRRQHGADHAGPRLRDLEARKVQGEDVTPSEIEAATAPDPVEPAEVHEAAPPTGIALALVQALRDEPEDEEARRLAAALSDGRWSSALHRGALEARTAAGRIACLRALGTDRDPAHPPVLRRALGDSLEEVRLVAAWVLACTYRDPAGLEVLVAATRRASRQPDTVTLAVEGLAALVDPRTVEALVRVLEENRAQPETYGPGGTALRRMFGGNPTTEEEWHSLAAVAAVRNFDGRGWRELWRTRQARFPAQLDPEKIPVAPVK